MTPEANKLCNMLRFDPTPEAIARGHFQPNYDMPPKHSLEEIDEIIQAVPFGIGWADVLVKSPDLSTLLAHIAQRAGITDQQIKRSRYSLPSFSRATWEDVAEKLKLPSSPKLLDFEEPFNPPTCFLPPSLHKAMFQTGWRAMDVYQERARQVREAARVKLLEPWLVPIVSLFEGRIVDQPESDMPATEYSTGGSVEHSIIMLGGALLLVIEMKLDVLQDDNLAQLFLELLSAAKVNENTNFGELRAYGLLTNLSEFRFYSYDPVTKSFSPDEDIFINIRRDDFCYGMIDVANKVFSVIMCAYVEGLRATVEASRKKSSAGDLSEVGSGPMQQRSQIPYIPPSNPTLKVKSKSRPSLSVWQNALAEAELAYSKLQQMSENLTTFEKLV